MYRFESYFERLSCINTFFSLRETGGLKIYFEIGISTTINVHHLVLIYSSSVKCKTSTSSLRSISFFPYSWAYSLTSATVLIIVVVVVVAVYLMHLHHHPFAPRTCVPSLCTVIQNANDSGEKAQICGKVYKLRPTDGWRYKYRALIGAKNNPAKNTNEGSVLDPSLL